MSEYFQHSKEVHSSLEKVCVPDKEILNQATKEGVGSVLVCKNLTANNIVAKSQIDYALTTASITTFRKKLSS